MIVAFIDELRRERIAVELTCAVLREQGCEVTARTYRAWRQPNRPPATRVVTDAQVIDALLAVVYDEKGQLTPEGLYGRRKMTALLRRKGLAVSHHTVDRLMRDLGLNGLRRSRKHRTTTPDPAGQRPTCSSGTSPRRPRTGSGSRTSPTSARGPGSSTSRSSSTCTPNGSWPGTPRPPSGSSWS